MFAGAMSIVRHAESADSAAGCADPQFQSIEVVGEQATA
jgi:hypothetical protein